ncbi:MAG: NAD(P)-binding domain-containing protein, partial [Gemmatimonadetes bacterium]|nr:NAD(P)-binding domain-containing protein [Gemmatimonadota bacterium]NIR41938.1 NAD(P)-binding domain-containing protein [Actinomycetota bacterium]NIS37046.1 NAD(P)-binding domain-containing protein [Actinomycetota bacterium]NIT99064.1 NAD(P)-binding domain-containing protein [Actinomycetota bacterium]NIU71509.1 NAD(P)-binding domain-containing protein [Actinomycetota bacterium]
MAYADLPMPRSWPAYLPHTLVLEYFERYAREYDLERHLTTGTEVSRVEPTDDGWEVTVRGRDGTSRTARYRSVFVCTGHHWAPHVPHWPGTFAGDFLHSREYRDPERFSGRRVLVIGIGNSGTDIAVDATGTAARVALSTRRGAHVVPRFVLGRPTDQWTGPETAGLPLPLARAAYRVLLWLSRG